MSSCDPELLRELAAADAQSPPPGGAAITPASLLTAEARRTRRQLATLAVASLLASGLALGWPRPTRPSPDRDAEVQAQLHALQTDVRRLQAAFAALPAVALPPTHDDAAATLRYQLANARAAAALAALPLRQEKR